MYRVVLARSPALYDQTYLMYLFGGKTIESTLTLYRSRTGIPEKYISDINQYSYPDPLKYDVPTQRANVKGHPVFYGSYAPGVTFEEMTLEPGSIVYLSEWKLNPISSISYAALLPDDLDVRNHLNGMMNGLKEAARIQLPEDVPDYIFEALYLNYRLISNYFTEPEEYTITAPIAHKILYQSPQFKALIYGSNKTKNRQCRKGGLWINRKAKTKIIFSIAK